MILDGEIVAYDARKSQFSVAATLFWFLGSDAIYHVFDVIFLHGHSTRG